MTVGKGSQQPALGCSQVSRMLVMADGRYRKLSEKMLSPKLKGSMKDLET